MNNGRTTTTIAAAIVGAAVFGAPATAERLCGDDAVFDLGGTTVLPFGGEILGASTLEGTVSGATVEIAFTTAGSFDAANVGFALCLPADGGTACHGVSGADLGWSGQGTFTAMLETNALDGDLALLHGPFYSWFAVLSNLDPADGPIEGTIDAWSYTLHFAACPVGDLTGDIAVGFDDLVILLSAWGPCDGAPCSADLDASGDVGLPDLLLLLSNWGDQFCPAPLC